MNRRALISLIVILVLAALVSCSAAPETTQPPSAPATAEGAPAAPAGSPTATYTRLAPPASATPTSAPAAPPTAAPPTSPPAIPPTQGPTALPTWTARPTVIAPPDTRFVGSFANGAITLRTNGAGTYVTLKEITLAGASCGGKKVNKHMTFESISFFIIENGEFSIEDEQAELTGVFDSKTGMHGSLTIKFNQNKTTCTIGPVNWTATAQ